MPDYVPINEYDLTAMTNAVNRYQAAGFTASYDSANRDQGTVGLMFRNPVRQDGSVVMFEIHKFKGRGFLLKRTLWVIQLYDMATLESEPVRKGCAFGSMLVSALTMAEKDVQHNFLSVLTFEMAKGL
jgi:hypothetical protein